jgi:hypothetical protein
VMVLFQNQSTPVLFRTRLLLFWRRIEFVLTFGLRVILFVFLNPA